MKSLLLLSSQSKIILRTISYIIKFISVVSRISWYKCHLEYIEKYAWQISMPTTWRRVDKHVQRVYKHTRKQQVVVKKKQTQQRNSLRAFLLHQPWSSEEHKKEKIILTRRENLRWKLAFIYGNYQFVLQLILYDINELMETFNLFFVQMLCPLHFKIPKLWFSYMFFLVSEQKEMCKSIDMVVKMCVG